MQISQKDIKISTPYLFFLKKMLENIIIPNPEKLATLKEAIRRDGAQKLHILADFDRTLTKAFFNDQSVPSLISVLRDGNYLTPDYAKKAQTLFAKYHPIEIDQKISKEEKKKAMNKWWRAHFNLLIKSGLKKSDIKKVVESSKIKLRPGALEFIDILHCHNVPLVIMSSSGLGNDAISMLLEAVGRHYDNIYIISNSYEWDEKGRAIAVKKPIIHCMNKNEIVVRDFPAFAAVKNRKNVLLLGDSLEDIGMITGFDYYNLIKIGFLNEKVQENLAQFQKNYDVVITNDAPMDYVNNLLKEILS